MNCAGKKIFINSFYTIILWKEWEQKSENEDVIIEGNFFGNLFFRIRGRLYYEFNKWISLYMIMRKRNTNVHDPRIFKNYS